MDVNIIPLPQEFSFASGKFAFQRDANISWSGPGAEEVAILLAEYLRPATAFAWPVLAGTDGVLHLQADGVGAPDPAGFVDETYALCIDAKGCRIRAANATGLARGIQTLRQLFPVEIFDSNIHSIEWCLPQVRIQDTPRFRWRGQHLDVCRHFFSVTEVCRFIDLLALHRLNMCHLHLTEDQGWRIEIKQYPRLTEVGSRRECSLIGHYSERPRRYDNTPYGGYYTQDDIRQIVAFAARRHVTLVPEIDMPGHMVAAISAYPELGNFKRETEVRCHWGISQQVLNVETATVTFMKNVLSEVMELFPGKFIHIGGDEAPKTEWSESRRAQARMAELGLQNENELQSWFIRQMDAHITAAGRRTIGWDEILEGGLAAGAAVMSWRGDKGGLSAAAAGHDVVMANQQYFYFDYYQAEPVTREPLAIGGMLPIEKVYACDPIPAGMPPDQHAYVLGAQGQLWTEYMKTMDIVEYMGFPRICALAEVLWLNPDKKNYEAFLQRLCAHRKRLADLKVNAHPRPDSRS